MMSQDDDDEGSFGGMFEDGHWTWDDVANELVFVSDLPPEPVENVQRNLKAPTGKIEFRDDIDLIEQVRYRRRYQRKLKPDEPAIVTLQDVKDIVLYTAPTSILSPMLINMLHIHTTERFLRALILCMAYYLQLSEKMAHRAIEQETKVRTPDCNAIENEYRENLSDLRLLVGKEYATVLIGGNDTKKFHHMGVSKKRRSLSDKDARFIETLLCVSVQIVWIALGRRDFNQIEVEVHRLFKSETFNNVEHNLKTEYIAKMNPYERNVLLGTCVRCDKKLKICSPLSNELFCSRDMNFCVTGLGVIEYPQLSNRLKFFWIAIAAKEEQLVESSVPLGIIGMPRGCFDTMLRPLPQISDKSNKSGIASRSTRSSYSSNSMKKTVRRLYPDIALPQRSHTDAFLPETFPDTSETPFKINEIQHRRWINRVMKLTRPSSAGKRK